MIQSILRSRIENAAYFVAILFCLQWITTTSAQELPDDPIAAPTTAVSRIADVEEGKFGTATNVHQCGNLYFSGQFGNKDLVQIVGASVKRIISLRATDEIGWNEKKAVESANIEFIRIPFQDPETLTDEVFDRIRELLKDSTKKTLFHCTTANRVGAVWLPFRVLDQGVSVEAAFAEAKFIGLRSTIYQSKALNYIHRKRQERKYAVASVSSVINSPFLASDMDVATFVKRFELESREVYANRKEILEACQLKPTDRVADIGAGTGLFTRLFARELDESGWVFAVDIAPGFVEHINKIASQEALKNITSVLCTSKSANLQPDSVDVIFICDTYHHFEYPMATLKSLNSALRPKGQLIVIDFERIPDKSKDWIIDHVRAGKDVFRAEIQEAGFELVEEVKISEFKENYFLRFRKSN